MQVVERKYTKQTLEPVIKEVIEQVIVTSDGREWNMSDRMRADKHESRLLILKELDLQSVNLPMYNNSVEYVFSKTFCLPDNVNREHVKVLNEFVIDDIQFGNNDGGLHYYDSLGKIKPAIKGKYLIIVNETSDDYRYCAFFGTVNDYINEANTYISKLVNEIETLKNL